MSADGTRLLLTYEPERTNVWLRFGHARAELILSERHRVVEFAPRALCCRVRWQANGFGTTEWRLTVLRTGAPGEAIERVVGIAPGASVLLDVSGERSVKQVLALIDHIEALAIDPAHTAPEYWRVVHQRLAVRAAPTPYCHGRHSAYLLRAMTS